MSAAKAFFDTNVLLYMYSRADPGKQARAKQVFIDHARANLLLLSTQVVQEFYVAGSRKLGMPRLQVQDAVSALLDLPMTIVGMMHIRSAMQLEERYKISFWDALILAAAQSAGADILYTEDLNNGQQYGTVIVRNPFLTSTV